MKFLNFLLMFIFYASVSFAHCQVPCGIYDDDRVFSELFQHVQTIRKAVVSVNDLQGDSEQNDNQRIRWVVNKEEHAQLIQDTMNHYFLVQRIKPPVTKADMVRRRYLFLLEKAHAVLVLAMKAKQKSDLGVVDDLKVAVEEFQEVYQR